MSKFRFVFSILAASVLTLTLSSLAQAQATRTWVSGVGDDVNPCSRTAPCKTFAGAISKTAAGGEINAIDPGGFGAVTITKNMTIDGGGTFASILASSVNGVNVNDSASGTPNQAIVTLRNISINGAGTTLGVHGVNFTSGKTVNIENCLIFNFSSTGIRAALTVSGSNMNVKDTNIFRTVTGASVTTTVNFVTASFDNVRVSNNTTSGINFAANGFGTVRNSLINFNGIGVQTSGTNNTMNVISSEVNHNTTGVQTAAGTTANLGSNTIIDNNTNFSNNGAIGTWTNNQTPAAIPGAVTTLQPR